MAPHTRESGASRVSSRDDENTMTDLLADHTVTCPSCWEAHTVTIDLTAVEEPAFIEDCHVCCNPMRISFAIGNDAELLDVSVESL